MVDHIERSPLSWGHANLANQATELGMAFDDDLWNCTPPQSELRDVSILEGAIPEMPIKATLSLEDIERILNRDSSTSSESFEFDGREHESGKLEQIKNSLRKQNPACLDVGLTNQSSASDATPILEHQHGREAILQITQSYIDRDTSNVLATTGSSITTASHLNNHLNSRCNPDSNSIKTIPKANKKFKIIPPRRLSITDVDIKQKSLCRDRRLIDDGRMLSRHSVDLSLSSGQNQTDLNSREDICDSSTESHPPSDDIHILSDVHNMLRKVRNKLFDFEFNQ